MSPETHTRKKGLRINGHRVTQRIMEEKEEGEWGIKEVTCSCQDCGENAYLEKKFIDTATDREFRIGKKWMYGHFSSGGCINVDV